MLQGVADHSRAIRVITAPSFLATKLVSYQSRGARDPFGRLPLRVEESVRCGADGKERAPQDSNLRPLDSKSSALSS